MGKCVLSATDAMVKLERNAYALLNPLHSDHEFHH